MQLEIKPETKLELALAKVKIGKEDQLFSRYFPEVGPLVAEYGGLNIGGFRILDSNLPEAPEMGVFFTWPSAAKYDAFHADARFKKLEPLRSDALAFLSNAHFFAANAGNVFIDKDVEYLLAIVDQTPTDPNLILEAPLSSDSPNTTHQGRSLVLSRWDADAEHVNASIWLRIQFNG